MRLIGLKNCDTCKKALKELAADGWDVEFCDVRGEAFDSELQKEILLNFNEKTLNRASTTWRGLDEMERQKDPKDLLAAHPTLMKRPVIEHDGTWTLGWKDDAKAQWLGAR